MKDPARIERIIGKLKQAWMSNPEQRLAQLLNNLNIVNPKLDDALAEGAIQLFLDVGWRAF